MKTKPIPVQFAIDLTELNSKESLVFKPKSFEIFGKVKKANTKMTI